MPERLRRHMPGLSTSPSGLRNFARELVDEVVQRHPIGVFVVARGVGRRAGFPGDAPHHEANQEIVLGVEQRAGHGLDALGMPTRVLEETVEHSLYVRNKAGVLLGRGVGALRASFAERDGEECRGYGFQFGPVLFDEFQHLRLMPADVDRCSQDRAREILEVDGGFTAKVFDLGLETALAQILRHALRDLVGVAFPGCVEDADGLHGCTLNATTASGGRVTRRLAGRPWNSMASASTAPPLPRFDPPNMSESVFRISRYSPPLGTPTR